MNDILAEYDRKHPLYNEFRLYCESLLRQMLQIKGIRVHMVDSRLKSRASLADKLQRPDKTYRSFEEVTDIVGLRVITYFDDEVDAVGELIENELETDPRTVDKRKTLGTSEFGYLSMHYVVLLDKKRRDLIECQRFTELRCEIQVRSVLQHAWAEIEHDLEYKASSKLPTDIQRKFHRLASTLEGADADFRSIRDQIRSYAKDAKDRILTSSDDLDVDEITIRTLMKEGKLIEKVDGEIAKIGSKQLTEIPSMSAFLANALRSVGFTKIAAVQRALEAQQGIIITLANSVLDKRSTAALGRGISLSYLYLITLGEHSRDAAVIRKNFMQKSVAVYDPRLSPENLSNTVGTLKKQIETEAPSSM